MKTKRYLPSKPFPPYAFIPGKFPHPEKAGGHMENEEVAVSPLTEDSFFENEGYLYGIDLFNHGYFWESHVWWEALWNEAGRKGDTADFLKALIKLAAGGVKEGLDQETVAKGHQERAIEIFEPLAKKQENWFGINCNELLSEIPLHKCRDLKLILKQD